MTTGITAEDIGYRDGLEAARDGTTTADGAGDELINACDQRTALQDAALALCSHLDIENLILTDETHAKIQAVLRSMAP